MQCHLAVNYQSIYMNAFVKLLAKSAWDSVSTGPYWILFFFCHSFQSFVDSRLYLTGDLHDHW